MLNELFAIERGLTASRIPVAAPHPDLNEVGKGEVLRVRLGADGGIIALEPIPVEARADLWTLRDGKHNSFPYVKSDGPLLRVPTDQMWATEHRKTWRAFKSGNEKRTNLAQLARDYAPDPARVWPVYLERLKERLRQLELLRNGDAAPVPIALERFLAATNASMDFVGKLVDMLLRNAKERDESWLELTHTAFLRGIAFYFDVPESEFDRDASDRRNIEALSAALAAQMEEEHGKCALSGRDVPLHRGNFPAQNLPALGPTILFSKYSAIPAAFRYGRADHEAFRAGQEIVSRLKGALGAVTAPHKEGLTWLRIPSEKPGKRGKPGPSDLFLAFVPSDLDVALAKSLSESGDPDKAYADLAKRVTEELDGTIKRGFAQEQVQILILRKVDPGNHKVIYHRSPTAGEIHKFSRRWRDGCLNFPSHTKLAVLDAKPVCETSPPYIPPTSLPQTTRALYASGGTRRVDVIGRPAAEAFALFLEEGDVPRRAHDLLRVFLSRHGALLSGTAHALRRGFAHAKDFDRAAALRSITWIALLLHKIGRSKEVYMSEAAFKLGQLLAVADVVHAGYCADVRQGDVPPTLLGNSVLSMAQSRPVKALAVLCGRWKPYGAWTKRAANVRKTADRLVGAKGRDDQDRGWAIRRALSQASRVSEISGDLSRSLPERADDTFRAELLLGYIAGLPKNEKTGD